MRAAWGALAAVTVAAGELAVVAHAMTACGGQGSICSHMGEGGDAGDGSTLEDASGYADGSESSGAAQDGNARNSEPSSSSGGSSSGGQGGSSDASSGEGPDGSDASGVPADAATDTTSASESSDSGTGQVFLEASLSYCALVSGLSVSPNNGGSVILSGMIFPPPPFPGEDAYTGPAPVAQWTAVSGAFTDPTSTDTTFICGPAGLVTVTLTAVSPGCDQHSSAIVTCM